MSKRREEVSAAESHSDRSLMERIQVGDQSALDQVLAKYWRPLVGYAERLLGSTDSAEDVVQDAIVRLWEDRGKWDPSHRLQGFLYRVVRNLCLNRIKHLGVHARSADEIRRRSARAVPTPSEEFSGSELERALESAIQDLPPKRREVFVLSRYHGLSYREIADSLDISPQTVANQMSTALDELRVRLDRFLPDSDRMPYLKVVGGSPSRP